MEIKVLGTGCHKCKQLVEQVQLAADELRLDCKVEKVEDIRQIMAYGVMMTPALVVDGRVVVTGKVPSLDDLKKMIGQ